MSSEPTEFMKKLKAGDFCPDFEEQPDMYDMEAIDKYFQENYISKYLVRVFAKGLENQIKNAEEKAADYRRNHAAQNIYIGASKAMKVIEETVKGLLNS